MPAILNPYMDFRTDANEQNLVKSLTTEFIRFHSIGIVYLPRTMRREDTLYNEDILSQFTRKVTLPVYLKDFNGWGGVGDFLSKFGTRVTDTMTMVVARERFVQIMARSGMPEYVRPLEGDLIYIPMPMNAVFEIKFVEHEKSQAQFYPLGGLNFFEIRAELHVDTQEYVATGNTSIDIQEFAQAYSQELVFSGGVGTYTVGETAFQGASVSEATATGVVGAWTPNTLSLTYITGEFGNTGNVVGATSGAVYTLSAAPDTLTMPNDPTNDNKYILDEADSIIVTGQ